MDSLHLLLHQIITLSLLAGMLADAFSTFALVANYFQPIPHASELLLPIIHRIIF